MTSQPSLIPQVQSLRAFPGTFSLTPLTTISYVGDQAHDVAELLGRYLRPPTGFALPVAPGDAGDVRLLQTGADEADEAGFVRESYVLRVAADAVRLEAATSWGLARGVQTLRQLLPASVFQAQKAGVATECKWAMGCVEIRDAPRFRWRGMHLDVCRHFFSLDRVKDFVDVVALHRMNVVHLHLTDDQGWRIEIQKYPRLSERASVRRETLVGHERDRPRRFDSEAHGGFYTQEALRDLVAFAAERRVTLVPEIDMPGHMVAAISAYPEWGNHPNNHVEPRCHWGISQQVLNVEQATVEAMKDVLTEVMGIFPGKFIHVGGDEAPRTEWSECKRAQERMVELGLRSEAELQGWFLRQMDAHVAAAGRRLIGWDEILEGGIAPNASVMSWRGEEGGLEASRSGHDVVMTPCQRVYFDYYQREPTAEEPLAIGGLTTTAQVYAYEPVPEAMTADKAARVLGTQGQLWTEYIATWGHLEYMAFPRACALSEVAWAESDGKDFACFLRRLEVHRKRLQALGVNVHPEPTQPQQCDYV